MRPRSLATSVLFLLLGTVFVAAIAMELKSGAPFRAQSPAFFIFFLGVQTVWAVCCFAAGAKELGVKLPVAPVSLVIATLSAGGCLGLWVSADFALKIWRVIETNPNRQDRILIAVS